MFSMGRKGMPTPAGGGRMEFSPHLASPHSNVTVVSCSAKIAARQDQLVLD